MPDITPSVESSHGDRIDRINAALDRLRLSKAEVARRIGRSYGFVVELLNGTEPSGAPTLALIEDLVEQVEEDA